MMYSTQAPYLPPNSRRFQNWANACMAAVPEVMHIPPKEHPVVRYHAKRWQAADPTLAATPLHVVDGYARIQLAQRGFVSSPVSPSDRKRLKRALLMGGILTFASMFAGCAADEAPSYDPYKAICNGTYVEGLVDADEPVKTGPDAELGTGDDLYRFHLMPNKELFPNADPKWFYLKREDHPAFGKIAVNDHVSLCHDPEHDWVRNIVDVKRS